MNDIVREFLLESNENLAQLDLDLVTLEQEPGERETLARAFRTLHTVKGTAGFLGLAKLQGVSHAAEGLLSRLRAGDLTFGAEIATALLGVVDAVRKMLAALEASGGEGDGDYTELIQTLERLAHPAAAPRSRIVPLPVPPSPPAAVSAPAPAFAFAKPASVVLEPTRTVPVPVPRFVPAPPAPAPPDSAEVRAPLVADTSIRVDVGLLDKLMTLVGELVLARNQIVQHCATEEDAAFLGTVQRLNLLTTELQAGVMKTRMQPIGNVLGKFPRVVRDLALACGKQVRLDTEGRDTELDRTIIEAIRDPLTHLVRNAVDHGIETPAGRVAWGKPVEGRLLLRAFHESGKVVIEIADDGAGIDPNRVRDKALATKLVAPDRAAAMSERELLNLVFLPGFSTADRVTHFSGRGVGMDVVRTNIEKIGGTVDLDSRPGRGTTVRMKIPLTLAIIPALTVTSGGDRYAIPQVSLVELLHIDGDRAARAVESVHGAPVFRLRGNLLPLVFLDRAFGGAAARPAGSGLSVVVLQADDRQFGLVVDDIHDTEEIVVKPLQKQLKGVGVFAGATIMGDGKVALILDVLGLAQHAQVLSGTRARARPEGTAPPADAADRQTVLLFAAPGGGRMAVPLARVARLEEFPRAAVEKVGGGDVVQYRGEILPLVHVGRVLGARPRRAAGRATGRDRARDRDGVLRVVVYSGLDRRAGLVVGRVIDIVDEAVAARAPATRPGVLFTAVVRDRVTEFLDVDALLGAAGGRARE